MLNSAKFTNDSLFCFNSLVLVHRGWPSTYHISHLSYKSLINLCKIRHFIFVSTKPNLKIKLFFPFFLIKTINFYPKEVIGVVASKTNKLENVINRLGCNTRVEPEFNVPILGLQSNKKKKKIADKPTSKNFINGRPTHQFNPWKKFLLTKKKQKTNENKRKPEKQHDPIRVGVHQKRRQQQRMRTTAKRRRLTVNCKPTFFFFLAAEILAPLTSTIGHQLPIFSLSFSTTFNCFLFCEKTLNQGPGPYRWVTGPAYTNGNWAHLIVLLISYCDKFQLYCKPKRNFIV